MFIGDSFGNSVSRRATNSLLPSRPVAELELYLCILADFLFIVETEPGCVLLNKNGFSSAIEVQNLN